MSWPAFLEKGKISVTFLLPIALLTGCLIFLPTNVKNSLSVELFAKKYNEYIGPAFLVSSVLVLINFISSVYNGIMRKIRYARVKQQIKQDIQNLSYHEKSVIREFYLLSADTIPLPLQNATVAGLVNKYILRQIGSYGGISHSEPCLNYALTTLAKKHINFDLIDLPVTNSEKDLQYLKNSRPEWIRPDYY